MTETKKIGVLFVCMGNICRSPTAEGIFRRLVEMERLSGAIRIDSAGTHDYHIGEAPDERAQLHARKRGYDLSTIRARQIRKTDFAEFDYVLAMDRTNLLALQRRCPERHLERVQLFLSFADGLNAEEVPDPYYGGAKGFETVLDMVENAATGLLRHLRSTHLNSA